MVIVTTRTRVKVLSTSNMNSLLYMKNQLLEHPVVVRHFNICFPNFPVSHDTRCVETASGSIFFL